MKWPWHELEPQPNIYSKFEKMGEMIYTLSIFRNFIVSAANTIIN